MHRRSLRNGRNQIYLYSKKLEKLIPELSEHPRTGKGHPEPLKGGNDITYSRHITAQDRIIYDILDEEILVSIIELEGHYNDK